MKRFWFATIAITSLFTAADAFARNARVMEVPNGASFNCGTCHVQLNAGGARNTFGMAVENNYLDVAGAMGVTQWNATIAMEDADNDGYPNGLELGDPDGDGTPIDGAMISNPGNAESGLCGDGNLQAPPEDCEGVELNGETCETQGFLGGTLACNLDCTFNTINCNNDPVGGTNNGTNGTNNGTGGTNTGTGGTGGMSGTGGGPSGGGSLVDDLNGNNQNTDDDGNVDANGKAACSSTGATNSPLWLILLALVGFRRREFSR